jgi:beta-glucuronidase
MPEAVSTPTIDPFAHLHDEHYANAYDQPTFNHSTLINIHGRPAESLDGPWFFTLDLFDEGLRQKWFADGPLPATAWPKPRDYDASAGQQVDTPSCWSLLKPEWRHFEGAAWYTRTLHHEPNAALPRSVLRVGAANYQARVFLNGVFLGAHLGGSTPFCVELSAHLQVGPNRLQIQVDNRRLPHRVPMNHFDWFNHGGIYREVQCLKLPKVFIRDAALQLIPNSNFNTLAADITLSDAVDGVARVRVAELGINAPLAITAGVGRMELKAAPALWSPQSPRLYTVAFEFEGDTITEQIGFREIRAQGQHILLNGKPVYLKGICVHEDDVLLGKVSTEADVRRRLADAKALGCNFLRLSHYPHHEHVAQLADELGFLLWEEIPVYWAIDFANPATLQDASNQLQELIRRDRNRASVILWGVGNENEDSDARLAFMRHLAEVAKTADPTRLVGAACLINREKFCIEDRLTDHIDVIGINEYFGWYEPDFDGLTRLLNASAPNMPVIISETGADALAGHHGAANELFTEECQAHVYAEQIARIEQAPYVCGFTPWLLYDFRSERRQTVFNQGFNRKGLIAEDKTTRKLAFAVLADFYHRKTT